jgi:protein TonB
VAYAGDDTGGPEEAGHVDTTPVPDTVAANGVVPATPSDRPILVSPSIVVDEPAVAAVPRRHRAFRVAVALSVALHAALLLAVLYARTDTRSGALATPSEAISVELVPSSALESTISQKSSEPAPAVASAAPIAGQAAPDASSEDKPAKSPSSEPQAIKEPKRSVDRLPATAAEPAGKEPDAPPVGASTAEAEAATLAEPNDKMARVASEKAERAEPRRDAHKTTDREEEQREKRAERRARAGGVTSRSREGKGSGSPRASASTGAILTYAARVRARVAGNKPAGAGQRGTTVVTFGVTPSGGLAFASITRSSGSAALDHLALAAVRGAAPFPPPPAGATPAQLRFSIPFHFQ